MSSPIRPPLTIETIDKLTSGHPINTIKVTNGDLTVSGTTATIDTSGSGGVPGGSTTEIQYNNAGAFGGSPDFFFSDIGGAKPKLNILSSTTANKAVYGTQSIVLDGGTTLPTITTTTGDDGLLLSTGTLGLSGAFIHLDGVSSPTQMLLRNAETDGTIKIETTAGTGDITVSAIGDLHLGGGLTLDLTAATTASVTSTATNNNMNFNIIANGSGTPKTILKNASMEVDLTCEADGKLYIRDPTSGNRFILDSSGAATGITFPDSTVQTTAATGGGTLETIGVSPRSVPTIIAVGDVLQYPMTPQLATDETSSNGMVNFNTTTAQLYPFLAPASGDIQSLTIRLTGANDDDFSVSLFTSDANGMPSTAIGTENNVWDLGTAGIITLDLSAVASPLTVVAGTNYWIGIMLSSAVVSRPTVYCMHTARYHSFNIPLNDDSTTTYKGLNTHYELGSLSAALPSTITTANLTGVGYANGGLITPYIMVVIG